MSDKRGLIQDMSGKRIEAESLLLIKRVGKLLDERESMGLTRIEVSTSTIRDLLQACDLLLQEVDRLKGLNNCVR